MRVLIVDNGSTDGSVSFIKRYYPQFSIYLAHTNLGFTGANNLGIQYALDKGADYVLLLNNDTRVEPDWLEALVEVAESDPKVGLCESQQYTFDGQHKIMFNYRPEWAEGETYLEDPDYPLTTRPVYFAAGCSLLIRMSMLQEIGLLDDRYFAGVEDVDLSLRAWITGYRVVSVPNSIVYHYVSASSNLKQRSYWGYRNQLFTLLKNYELSTLVRFAVPILRRWIFTRNRVALKASAAVIVSLPKYLRLRQQIQQLRRRSDANLFKLLETWSH
jgi:GT2 family glycosyltransferase